MQTNIKANVNQFLPDVLTEGVNDFPAMSKTGQLWTAGWQVRLVLAGKAFRLSIGTVTGSGDITMVGNGTAIELEKPAGYVVIDEGYLIPLSLNLAVNSSMKSDNDELDVLLTSDRTTAITIADVHAAAGTAETPDNLLDGAEAFTGRTESICTSDITNPAHNDVLFYKHWERIGAAPKEISNLSVDHMWEFPTFLRGGCSILLYVGATQAPTFIGSFVFAHIPVSWLAVV